MNVHPFLMELRADPSTAQAGQVRLRVFDKQELDGLSRTAIGPLHLELVLYPYEPPLPLWALHVEDLPPDALTQPLGGYLTPPEAWRTFFRAQLTPKGSPLGYRTIFDLNVHVEAL